jgi:hypothetical protein
VNGALPREGEDGAQDGEQERAAVHEGAVASDDEEGDKCGVLD